MNSEFYTEGCNFVRHYSNCSLTVRALAVVQGLVLLSAWTYTFLTEPNPLCLFFVAVFGLLFTLLLFGLHWGYYMACQEYSKYVIDLEELGNGESHQVGPVGTYEAVREPRFKPLWRKLATIHAPFTLIGVAFTLLIILSSGIWRWPIIAKLFGWDS